eukprot:COSAG02_NODE_195_length_29750_cov_79.793329_1_plen_339_part_00
MARFDVVAVNKMEGVSEVNSTGGQEQRQIETLRRVKALKPSVFTIAYMNSMMNFDSQSIAPEFTDDLLVRNASGDVALFHGDGWRATDGPTVNVQTAFNLSVPAARQIWLDDLQHTFLDSGVVDGIFADKGNNWAGNGHCNGPRTDSCWQMVNRNDTLCQNTCVAIDEEQAAAYNRGKIALFEAAETTLRARGGLLALKNDTDPLYSARAQYKRIVRPTRESVEEFIALEGQLDTVIAWALPGNSPKSHNQTNWHNTIAAFLIAVWDGMFLMASPCCGTNATAAWTDEYSRPLGPPLAKATLLPNGTFYREFASGTKVYFDTLIGEGTIAWASTQIRK